MNPLDYVKAVLASATQNVPAPVQRFAGQAWNRIPIAINPLRTRTPTTILGKLGKEVNPLSRRNAAFSVALDVIPAMLGIKLAPEEYQRLDYFSMGPQVGLAANILDAGAAGAKDEKALMAESMRYFAAKEAANPTAAAPASTSPRVDASTTQMIDIGAPAPRQAPRITPVTPTAPPTPVISQAAYNAAITGTQAPANIPLSEFYAAQRSIGQYAEQGGELQRRLKEAGGAAGMTDEALMAWAQRNPDLALRELMKREKRTGMSVD